MAVVLYVDDTWEKRGEGGDFWHEYFVIDINRAVPLLESFRRLDRKSNEIGRVQQGGYGSRSGKTASGLGL